MNVMEVRSRSVQPYFVGQGVPLCGNFSVVLGALDVTFLQAGAHRGAIAGGPFDEFGEKAAAITLGGEAIEKAEGLFGERNVDTTLHGCGTSHLAVSLHTGVCIGQSYDTDTSGGEGTHRPVAQQATF